MSVQQQLCRYSCKTSYYQTSVIHTRLKIMDPKPSELLKISKQIREIDELGLNLDFTNDQVQAYEAENEKDSKKAWKGTFRMLEDWFNKDESTREKLIEALRESNMTDLADRVKNGKLTKNQEIVGAAAASTSHHACSSTQPVPADQSGNSEGGISDETLKNIGKSLFHKIDDFGSALGVDYSTRRKYSATNYRTDSITSDGTVQMLFDWREKVPPSEQRTKLGQALEKAKLLRVKEEFHL